MTLRFSFVERIAEIGADGWNGLADTDYPFLRYEYLQALEASGSVSEATGWLPYHLIARSDDEKTAVLMPLYRKMHSWGEYVFDWSWADAYERYGLPYYPKLLTAIPFTPCEGPRLLIRSDIDPQAAMTQATTAIETYAERERISSWHVLFPDVDAQTVLDGTHLLQRQGVQFHWQNPGCEDFEAFLGLLTSRRRKNIRRERAKVRESGFTFRWLEGREITDAQLHYFYVFYQATYMKRGQRGYLSRTFFEEILRTMPEQALLVFAERENRPVAAAFFFKGTSTLYGRYWGCLEEFDQLHFETCYYQGLDYCLAQGLPHFDAGAQGEHKLLRGFKPRITRSYHWIAESAFRDAIADFLRQETLQVKRYFEEAETVLPYRHS
ncbi:GNAT family N-acetyltransferase [Alkalilimnicola ehrlichii]|uniref:GNAT family N-acetyltransferase n=1 Tax=Alkalilimnicola ehrlichii TaxID=351052 RepID=A0A3E0WH25_9GAMM|nr:GNAT family N-acetyltransferase [Alkalilimnicola ehrlichii]RFA25183.1 GNAT family N-acetyltransferase [Alkalilimnicola ehrlichii]RFA32262.1 GNAT family N-acetyltransferase [Alkalilimnicola ehrlichii]